MIAPGDTVSLGAGSLLYPLEASGDVDAGTVGSNAIGLVVAIQFVPGWALVSYQGRLWHISVGCLLDQEGPDDVRLKAWTSF